jgi:hypothetical protein
MNSAFLLLVLLVQDQALFGDRLQLLPIELSQLLHSVIVDGIDDVKHLRLCLHDVLHVRGLAVRLGGEDRRTP